MSESASSAADRLSLNKSQVNRYLRGDQYPSVRTIRRIEDVYDWPILDQIDLIPEEGYDPDYGRALAKVLGIIQRQ